MRKILLAGAVATTLITGAVADEISSSTNNGSSDRQGFVLGLGGGFGSLSLDNGGYGVFNDFDESGFVTSFEIGYAFTNQFSVHYINNVTWASGDSIYGDDTHTGGFTGISANYYFEDAPETVYVVGGVGFASFSNFDTSDGDLGPGVLLGVGYAMNHIELEADIILGEIDGTYGNDSRDLFAFQATVSYHFH